MLPISHVESSIYSVGLDSEKRIFSEKMRKEGKRGDKEAIMYGKRAYDIIEINYHMTSLLFSG